MIVVDEFLRGERFYLARLEGLLDVNEQIKSSEIPLASDADAGERLFAQTRLLVNTQRQFMLGAEMLALKPYWDQTWHLLFRKWRQRSSASYAAFIAGGKRAMLVLRSAIALRPAGSVSAAGESDELQALISDALGILALPSQRLERYRAFLEVSFKYCG